MRPRQHSAVCLSGRVKGLAQTALSLANHLVRPLAADVFVYIPRIFVREASTKDVEALHSLPGLVTISEEEENVTLQLRSQLERQEWNHGGGEVDELLAMMQQVDGNWIGGYESRDGTLRRGTGLNQMYSLRWCLQMVEHHEVIKQARHLREWSYDWIIKSRLDFVWEAKHLPLRLFSKEYIWIPEGNDWGGYNDRHAVVPRSPNTRMGLQSPSQIYFNGWSWVASMTAVGTIKHGFWGANMCEARELMPAPCLNHESWLWLRVYTSRVPIARFPNLAWLSCGNKSALGRPGTQHNLGACLKNARPYRDPSEHAAAQAMARCLHGSASVVPAGPMGPGEIPRDNSHLNDSSLAKVWARVHSCWRCVNHERGVLAETYPREVLALCFVQPNTNL